MLYHTSFKLNVVNLPKASPLGPPMNPLRDSHCPPDPQLHFTSQFKENAEFFSVLANTLECKPCIILLFAVVFFKSL